MSNNVVNFVINVNGNSIPVMVELNDNIAKVKNSVDDTLSSFSELGKKALDFDVITNAIGKVSQAFQTMVGTSLDFEQQQANLKTLLNGDAEATENLVKQIREYGKATVYDRSSLVEAQKTMMVFGLDAKFAFGCELLSKIVQDRELCKLVCTAEAQPIFCKFVFLHGH